MRRQMLIPGLVVVLVGLLALPVVVAAQLPLSATVEFGCPDTGSAFDPGHDQSGHAKDRPVPRTIVISQGGIVTFRINARTHELAIYAAGTKRGKGRRPLGKICLALYHSGCLCQ